MLRITTVKKRRKVTLSVEGRLAGPSVGTLEQCWRELRAASTNEKFSVNLCGVSFIDAAGKVLLKEIHRQGGQLVAEGCLNQAIVREIVGKEIERHRDANGGRGKGSHIIFYLAFFSLLATPSVSHAQVAPKPSPLPADAPGQVLRLTLDQAVALAVKQNTTRILISFGCVVSALALFVMAGWDLGLDFGHAVRARMLQTFGLAFLFIPINVAAFAYVAKEKTNMGTGIINLARNIGASVGIATVTAMLERRTQFHQARLVDHVNNLNPAVRTMTNSTTLRLISHGSNAAVAATRSHGMIYNMVQRQAAMLAFLDNFKFLGIAFLAVIPALLLMRKPRVAAGGVPVH
jgi:ABC-type transporter Mla MlaB component